jgi:hypothetical protein
VVPQSLDKALPAGGLSMGARVSGRWRVIAPLVVGITALLLEPPASTQGRQAPRRHTQIGGHEAVEGEVLVRYRGLSPFVRHEPGIRGKIDASTTRRFLVPCTRKLLSTTATSADPHS